MLWLVNSPKILCSGECARTVKLRFLELVMAIEFALSERETFVFASCGMLHSVTRCIIPT